MTQMVKPEPEGRTDAENTNGKTEYSMNFCKFEQLPTIVLKTQIDQ
jgi:hypothetical protein